MKSYFLFLFICLFLKIESTFYLTMKLIDVNDYLLRIYNQKNEIFFECGIDENCKPYPVPIARLIPYEIGEKIFVDLYDEGGNPGFFEITVYINEYVIETNDQKFWKCDNCQTSDNNYYYTNNKFNFYDQDHIISDMSSGGYFNFYFQFFSKNC